MTILKTENVNKFFYDPTEFHVLKDVSFEVNKGELLTLVGKSGSGKSTYEREVPRDATHHRTVECKRYGLFFEELLCTIQRMQNGYEESALDARPR